jgi:hypothetical protein
MGEDGSVDPRAGALTTLEQECRADLDRPHFAGTARALERGIAGDACAFHAAVRAELHPDEHRAEA